MSSTILNDDQALSVVPSSRITTYVLGLSVYNLIDFTSILDSRA